MTTIRNKTLEEKHRSQSDININKLYSNLIKILKSCVYQYIHDKYINTLMILR